MSDCSESFVNVAAYKFVELCDRDELRKVLLKAAKAADLKGTVLLAPEGINLFVSGQRDAIDQFMAYLTADDRFADIEVKESQGDRQPFNRMLVRLKREIIPFGIPGVEPGRESIQSIQPRELKSWLDSGRPITLLDVRNDYEVKLGTFDGAIEMGLKHFRDFPEAIEKLPDDIHDRPLVMFCTGGIRCEKAGPYLERSGFRNVYQLRGGILKYFEDCGDQHYHGECFVFDHRVAVDADLAETGTAQCFACQSPVSPDEQASPRYAEGMHCPHCYETKQQEMRERLETRRREMLRIVVPLPGSIPYENRRPMKVPLKCDGMSLLEFLAELHPHIRAEDWLEEMAAGKLVRGGQPVGIHASVRAGQRIDHLEPDAVEPDVNADIGFLYEDDWLVVVNKPAPLPMHPSGRFNRNTLRYILQQLYLPHTPRHAHRLDANTSGVVVLSKTRRTAGGLQPQFERGDVKKCYVARVRGCPVDDRFSCEESIGDQKGTAGARRIDNDGRPATTHFTMLSRFRDGSSLCQAVPRTGRTNQIRLHLAHLGFPVVGDPVYNSDASSGKHQVLPVGRSPMCLHAQRIEFVHPETHALVSFEAPLPAWAEDCELLAREPGMVGS